MFIYISSAKNQRNPRRRKIISKISDCTISDVQAQIWYCCYEVPPLSLIVGRRYGRVFTVLLWLDITHQCVCCWPWPGQVHLALHTSTLVVSLGPSCSYYPSLIDFVFAIILFVYIYLFVFLLQD
uniref:Uncharacterized protein n=1 Tax=Trypanosoma vivax (strain Y486) TaxID=1055687 RepID=G0TTJ8_TRYVY|nr:hypothetical protein TVY486_0304520 [Trypanosoma vivax Y486]